MSNMYNDMDVKLSERSKESLKLINQNTQLAWWLKFFTGAGGAFDSVFSTNKYEKVFHVTQTDFVKITQAVHAVSKMECAMIKRIAFDRRLDTYGDERKFWDKINDSCSTQ